MNHKRPPIRPGRLITRIAAGTVAFLACLQSASAAPLFNTPVYNPHTKSYFLLVKQRAGEFDRGVEGNRWINAEQYAEQHVFKGVRGRLAVVKDLETTAWVEATFRPAAEAWIGLRYVCNERQLKWTDGTYYRPGDFQLWTKDWYQSEEIPCSSTPNEEMPVEIYNDLDGVHWAARGYAKVFEFFFMEYPTGQP